MLLLARPTAVPAAAMASPVPLAMVEGEGRDGPTALCRCCSPCACQPGFMFLSRTRLQSRAGSLASRTGGPRSRAPGTKTSSRTASLLIGSDFTASRQFLQHQIDIGAVEELPADTVDGHWSFFVPVLKKNTDKVCGSFDLRVPNEHIQYEYFKMEGLQTAQFLIHCRNVMTKVDISDFFMHKPIGPPDRCYFCLMYNRRKFQYTTMPFGLCSAPCIATKLLQPTTCRLCLMGICLVVFIDDILLLSQSHNEAIRNTQKVVNFLHNLGYSIHPEQITAQPSCSSF